MRNIIFLLGAAAVLGGCSITRGIPEGSYVLTDNTIKTDRTTPRKERIKSAEISKYIRQKPASDLLGIRVWIYEQANPDKENWWNNLLRTAGTRPVVLDTLQTSQSSQNIKAYISSNGFFAAETDYRIDYNHRRRTAKVTYSALQGEPYRIEHIGYDYRDNFAQKLIERDTITSLTTGDILNLNALGEERKRVADVLRNEGYYDFSVADIEFLVDTTIGNHLADVEMVIKQKNEGFTRQGLPIETKNTVYRVAQTYIFPDYDATAAATDPDYMRGLDTTFYRGLGIIYSGKRPPVRPKVLRKLVSIKQNGIYSDTEMNRTYNNIMRLDYFRSSNIMFSQAPTPKRNITMVGDHWSETVNATEGDLICDIKCTPAQLQSYKIELEATSTSSYYGIATTLGYQNRNLFRGAELFDMSFTLGYEFLKLSDPNAERNSYEIGGRMGFTFPTFIAPFNVDPTGRINSAQTRLEFSINDQNRRYYKRTLSGVTWGYTWNNGRKNSYQLRPIDISIVKVGYVDPDFLERLKNPYLEESYRESQMMAGISASYALTDERSANSDYRVLRANASTSGNLISAVSSIVNAKKVDGQYELFGIPYAQYLRGDLSYSQLWQIGEKSAFVYRLYGGLVYPYGNSRNSSIPIDRLFYVGGINSMRGWTVRTLGPGSAAITSTDYPRQFGNMRLEANVEMRFPMWGIFDGAVFFDAGNVWYTPNITDSTAGSHFHLSTFLPQIGLNTGFGLRFNLQVLVLRLDWGVQLYNPNKAEGSRWVVTKFSTKNTALNFGIGYPF